MQINKAVILAGGMGTRFLPATLSIAKEMFPIIDKPILLYHLKECVNSGITECLIVSASGKHEIKKFFNPSENLIKKLKNNDKISYLKEYFEVINKLKITIVYQKNANGSAGAVMCAKKWANNQPFVLFNGDDVIDGQVPAAKQLMNVYEQTNCGVVMLKKVTKQNISKYGCADIILSKDDEFQKINSIVEKPEPDKAPSLYAVIGRYLVTPNVFNLFTNLTPKNGEYYFTDALNILCKTGGLYGKSLSGTYYDCGNKFEYAKCITDFMIKNEEYGSDYLKYLQSKLK